MEKAIVISTDQSYYLAELIAHKLGLKIITTKRYTFSGGERYYRLEITSDTELFGQDVIMVGTTGSDEELLELHRVGCALTKNYGARKLIFVIPFFGYSTMERTKIPGEVVTAKANALLLSSIPSNSSKIFLLLDLHAGTLVQFFEGECLSIELQTAPILLEAIKALGLENIIFASADLGRPKLVKSFADYFGTDIAFVRKDREFEKTQVVDVIGDVRGKTVIIYDDMIRSGGTLIDAARAYLQHGAKEVYAVVSHLAFNDESIVDLLLASPLVKIIATNSHPMSTHPLVRDCPRFKIEDISEVFTASIAQMLGIETAQNTLLVSRSA